VLAIGWRCLKLTLLVAPDLVQSSFGWKHSRWCIMAACDWAPFRTD
jgi:hypothetical protein